MADPSPSVLIACDKFRGSMTAADANSAIARGIAQTFPAATAVQIPIADGGEGTLAALTLDDTHSRTATVESPFGKPIDVPWSFDPATGLAVVELAVAAGHPTQGAGYDPDRATFKGVTGFVQQDGAKRLQRTSAGVHRDAAALNAGANTIVVAVGGSVTVDAGAGALEALGAVLLDETGHALERSAGRTLARVHSVDKSGIHPRLDAAHVILASDVDNPLCGPRGASVVFGPQKGVAAADIGAFDAALANFDAVTAAATGLEPLHDAPFAGAAGGMMVGLRAAARDFTARDGFTIMAERRNLADAIAAADWVVTGEGSMDQQSLSGKGPVALARMARDAGKPVVGFVGRRAVDFDVLRDEGFAAVFPLSPEPQTLDAALASAPAALEQAAAHAFGLIGAAQPKVP
ncbi:MAG: glycerate kinase [Pseudomonadota bacterium]